MVDRSFESEKCALDNQFRLHILGKILYPCKRINLPNLVIGIVDNNSINPKRLMLIDKDRENIEVFNPFNGEISNLTYPGKSSFIYYEECGKKIKDTILQNTGINTDRRDHLYLTSVDKVEGEGWEVWWAPLQLRGLALHCRLIHRATITEQRDPTLEEACRLANAFRKVM
ncbi:hypothetical protein KBB92_03320 [Candidatus Shapirobacteria bacterium]|nr:hypothetical protein [Candidatus Shapirobacteria bacterium]